MKENQNWNELERGEIESKKHSKTNRGVLERLCIDKYFMRERDRDIYRER